MGCDPRFGNHCTSLVSVVARDKNLCLLIKNVIVDAFRLKTRVLKTFLMIVFAATTSRESFELFQYCAKLLICNRS